MSVPKIGVYMTDDGPIEIREDMPRDQMWFVLQKLMNEYMAMRERHHNDRAFMAKLNKAARG